MATCLGEPIGFPSSPTNRKVTIPALESRLTTDRVERQAPPTTYWGEYNRVPPPVASRPLMASA